MGLINTSTLQLEEFFGSSKPPYAILSHTWEKEEVLFADTANLWRARAKAGFAKVKSTCALAARQGYDYVWIDTCCIDKSSSSELSEAINSMFAWYQESRGSPVRPFSIQIQGTCPEETAPVGKTKIHSLCTHIYSTLPRVEFYSASWDYLGEKKDPGFISTLSTASRVEEVFLSGILPLEKVCVAKKMYWASHRKTARLEDEAYCLMCLFQVNMPLLYGERLNAFMRLQHEIVKKTHDMSISAWYCDPSFDRNMRHDTRFLVGPVFARSPSIFRCSSNIALRAT
ncbi:hypothetical protein VTK26DRAFT_2921 [Humicola hyalothermophila]